MAEEEEREHAATARQRERFEEKGDLPNVRELTSAAILLTAGIAVVLGARGAAAQLVTVMRTAFNSLHYKADISLWRHMSSAYWEVMRPLFLTVIIVAVACTLLRTGGAVRFRSVTFDLSRVNPFSRLGQIFSGGEAMKTLGVQFIKMMAVAVLCVWVLYTHVPRMLQHVPVSLAAAGRDAYALLRALFLRGTLCLLALGLLDFVRHYYKRERRMSMTPQMLRDEVRDQMGDPAVRQRVRAKARELSRQRSLKHVPKADVVLVNPTHYAVALMYKAEKMDAPMVVAKGADAWAERIRSVARRHNIPVVPQPSLTRLLYRQVKVGKMIPEDLYQATALVLAHVYRIRRRVG